MKIYYCGMQKIKSVSICNIETVDDGFLFFTKNNSIKIHSDWLHYNTLFGLRFLYPLSKSQRNKVMKYLRGRVD
jgi:hypothetical protein